MPTVTVSATRSTSHAAATHMRYIPMLNRAASSVFRRCTWLTKTPRAASSSAGARPHTYRAANANAHQPYAGLPPSVVKLTGRRDVATVRIAIVTNGPKATCATQEGNCQTVTASRLHPTITQPNQVIVATDTRPSEARNCELMTTPEPLPQR